LEELKRKFTGKERKLEIVEVFNKLAITRNNPLDSTVGLYKEIFDLQNAIYGLTEEPGKKGKSWLDKLSESESDEYEEEFQEEEKEESSEKYEDPASVN
jgi:hypothetical protein